MDIGRPVTFALAYPEISIILNRYNIDTADSGYNVSYLQNHLIV